MESRKILGWIALVACLFTHPGCGENAQPPVLVGAAKRDITPDFDPYTDRNSNLVHDASEPFDDANGNGTYDSIWIGGFDARRPTGTHDPLWARSVAMKVRGELFCFTSLDTLGLSSKRIDQIRHKVCETLVAEGSACSVEHIIVSSTHSHQAPDTIGIFALSQGAVGWDENYLQLIVQQAADSILEAIARLEPAELVVTSAQAGEGIVRDIRAPDITDPYVGIVLARAKDGRTIATLTATASHPEAAWADNTRLSSDFLHPLREGIESALGGIAVAFSADLGMMQTPAEIGTVGFDRVQKIGDAYVERILAAVEDQDAVPEADLVPAHLYQTATVGLEIQELRLAIDANIAEGYQDYLYESDSPPCAGTFGCFDVPLFVLRLGSVITLVTVPGEITPELIVGGITSPAGYTGPYPDAPAEPHLVEHVRTRERFVIGLALAETGYIYPKKTYDPDSGSYRNSLGPNAAMPIMTVLTGMLDELNTR